MQTALIEGFFYGTTRLVDMQTIIELAFVNQSSHFRVVMRKLLPADINYSKLPHTRSINNPSSIQEIKHFRKSGGVTLYHSIHLHPAFSDEMME